jgi:hypothetical protein
MQPTDTGKPSRSQAEVPVLRASGGVSTQDQATAQVAAQPPSQCLARDPVAVCLSSLNYGEAPCVGFLGDRGTGKSRAMRAVAAGWLARSPGVVLALDKAGASGFAGQRRVSLADLRLHPPDREPRAIVFVGDLASGLDPEAEGVARFAWQLRATRTGSLVVVDELKWAAKAGFWRARAVWLPQTCTEGRKHDVGILWASQCPQDAPREAIEEASLLVVYHMAGLSVRCLRDRNYLVGMPAGVLEHLPSDLDPPMERGKCLILRRGHAWDRRFYRFP